MKTVIEMALEAGFKKLWDQYWDCTTEGIERFASLVRADERVKMAEKPAQQQELVAKIISNLEPLLATKNQSWAYAENALLELLAATPQPAQQEPVGRLESDPDEGHVFVPRIDGDWSMFGEDLYTSPPAQRTWVGLTPEELDEMFSKTLKGKKLVNWVARAVEAKLRSKNEDPQDHCMDCTRPRWEPVTQELLNNQHPWLYEPMWIAMKSGAVLQGIYEWRQGRNPDRFISYGGDDWAFDAAYVMPIVKPAPPAIEASHKENT